MDKIDWPKAPEGATHVGVRLGGQLCWYNLTCNPYRYQYEYSGEWKEGHHSGPLHKPLEPRPQPDNKEGDGVKWYEDGSFPPGGDRCEAYIMADARNQHGPAGKWIAGISRGKAIAFNGGWGGIFEADEGVMHFVGAQSHFRPIQSHRDKVIEAADNVWQHSGSGCTHVSFITLADDLYEAGMLKLPGDEQ